jgi:hypothetical protein
MYVQSMYIKCITNLILHQALSELLVVNAVVVSALLVVGALLVPNQGWLMYSVPQTGAMVNAPQPADWLMCESWSLHSLVVKALLLPNLLASG